MKFEQMDLLADLSVSSFLLTAGFGFIFKWAQTNPFISNQTILLCTMVAVVFLSGSSFLDLNSLHYDNDSASSKANQPPHLFIQTLQIDTKV